MPVFSLFIILVSYLGEPDRTAYWKQGELKGVRRDMDDKAVFTDCMRLNG